MHKLIRDVLDIKKDQKKFWTPDWYLYAVSALGLLIAWLVAQSVFA